MTRQDFIRFIQEHAPVILDGATGTGLMAAGMPVGVCPEKWILEHPDVLLQLQKDYIRAGSRILYAPTFTGNRIKLQEYGLKDRLVEINRDLVGLSRRAVEECSREEDGFGEVLVAGDLTMCGQQLYPLGELPFEELVEVYKEQGRVLADAGVDLFVVETMMSLQESRAALIALREISDLPVMVSLTYNEDGRTLYGTPPESAVTVLQALGADVIGVNCSTGPEEMTDIVKKMAEYAAIPILAKPNAGIPELEAGKTVYRMTPEEFAKAGVGLVEAGAALVGGCCGTRAEHIRALTEKTRGMNIKKPRKTHRRVISSERKCVEIDLEGNFMVVGERINPTGKKKLQAQLREGRLDMVRQFAMEQEAAGACILDVNTGMNGIDEKEMMQEVIGEVTSTVDCPLCIDTSDPEVMEQALRIYPGRALINSISLEQVKIDKILPVARKYGAMFILLPLSDEGLPRDIEEKHRILEEVYARAKEIGMGHEDIVVDALVATIGADPEAAKSCLQTVDYCRNKRKLPTICGLSNISFGLPERGAVNAAFLSLMIGRGLTMAIANPSQEILMNAAFASDMLLHHKDSDIRYIEHIDRISREREKKAAEQAAKRLSGPAAGIGAGAGGDGAVRGGAGGKDAPEEADLPGEEIRENPVYQAVLKGNKGTIVDQVKLLIEEGTKPDDIINRLLIPAIGRVGDLFNEKRYFLPQLIGSANAMKLAIDYIEPLLERKGDGSDLGTVVIATVEGDIHDIGKNLVALMLKNYGYRVVDLGKDVPADVVVETAIKENARIIALSALMTTTMVRMRDVVELAREKDCKARIIIGGACITESYAEEIGADGYSGDAADCVKLVRRLLVE